VGKIGEGQERTDGLEIAAELTPEHLKKVEEVTA